MELDVASDRSRPRSAVSALKALERAATGFGVVTAASALVGLVWREWLELAMLLLVLGSLQWLHEQNDRHHRLAIATAGVVALVTVIGIAVLFRQAPFDFSRDVAVAALGALAGSQAYAGITRRP